MNKIEHVYTVGSTWERNDFWPFLLNFCTWTLRSTNYLAKAFEVKDLWYTALGTYFSF